MTPDVPEYDPARHYDHVTEAWHFLLGDELHYGVFDVGDETLAEATRALTARMVHAAGLDAAGPHSVRVLDVGCGSGTPASELAINFGVEVVGITTSAVGVEAATERVAALGLDGVTFEQRDGMDNGFDGESFDIVWTLESAHLMRDRGSLIAECARVLRPGGTMVLCDLLRWREIPFTEVRERREDFATLRAAFGDAHFESLSYYAQACRSEGLDVEHCDDLSGLTLPTFDRWRANAQTHKDSVIALIGVEGHDAFVRSCDILEGLWRDGTFGYGLVSARKPA